MYDEQILVGKKTTLAELANSHNLGDISRHLWKACMMQTKKDDSNRMPKLKYDNIMSFILKEFEILEETIPVK